MREEDRSLWIAAAATLLVILIAAGPKIGWLLREKGWLGAD